MAVELSQIVEWISGGELARVDEAHEDVSHVSAIFGLIEQRVLSMQDRFFQSTFSEIVVEWCSSLSKKQREPIPTVGHVRNGCAQTGVRLDPSLRKLFGEPLLQLIH